MQYLSLEPPWVGFISKAGHTYPEILYPEMGLLTRESVILMLLGIFIKGQFQMSTIYIWTSILP